MNVESLIVTMKLETVTLLTNECWITDSNNETGKGVVTLSTNECWITDNHVPWNELGHSHKPIKLDSKWVKGKV